jgi:hypothetical protein
MEAAGSSEMLVPSYQTTLHHIQEDGNLIINSCYFLAYLCRRENGKESGFISPAQNFLLINDF